MNVKYEFLIATNRFSDYVDDAIKSVLNQDTSLEYSIRIVANGCDKEYQKFLNNYELKNSRIKVEYLNLGQLAFALNYGVSQSDADYLLRMDDDDISLKNRLEVTNKRIIEHGMPDVIAFGADRIKSNGELLKKNNSSFKSKIDLAKALPFKNPIIHPTTAIKRMSLLKIGGYLGSKTNEDYDLWIRMNREDYEIIREVDTVLNYRIHANQSAKNPLTYSYSAGYSLIETLNRSSLRWFFSIFFKIFKLIYFTLFK